MEKNEHRRTFDGDAEGYEMVDPNHVDIDGTTYGLTAELGYIADKGGISAVLCQKMIAVKSGDTAWRKVPLIKRPEGVVL